MHEHDLDVEAPGRRRSRAGAGPRGARRGPTWKRPCRRSTRCANGRGGEDSRLVSRDGSAIQWRVTMAKNTPQPGKTPRNHVKAALDDPTVPKLYANGFTVGFNNADAFVMFTRFDAEHPVALVNLSYTLAKTLAQRLTRLVSDLESRVGQEILTTDRVDEKAREAAMKKTEGGGEGGGDH